MSYIRADKVLPKELVEAIQQYVDGETIYIPKKERQGWGSKTAAGAFFRGRNKSIYEAFCSGASIRELARGYSLSEKSIQRILREKRLASAKQDANT